jgi:hypothetical protein
MLKAEFGARRSLEKRFGDPKFYLFFFFFFFFFLNQFYTA